MQTLVSSQPPILAMSDDRDHSRFQRDSLDLHNVSNMKLPNKPFMSLNFSVSKQLNECYSVDLVRTLSETAIGGHLRKSSISKKGKQVRENESVGQHRNVRSAAYTSSQLVSTHERTKSRSEMLSPRLTLKSSSSKSPKSSRQQQQQQMSLLQVVQDAPKVTMHCKDGVVIVNGESNPIFVPKLNLQRITSNREIAQPLPIPRKSVLKNNDDIFQHVMKRKSLELQRPSPLPAASCLPHPHSATSECWSTKSHSPTDASLTYADTELLSDTTSTAAAASKKLLVKRQNTFMFKCVDSILNKFCNVGPEELSQQDGKVVIEYIQSQRNRKMGISPVEEGAIV